MPEDHGPVRTAHRAGARTVLAAAALALLVSGCGASSVRLDGARDAGRRFERALTTRSFAAACELLAPETRGRLERDEGRGCDEALGEQRLPAGPPGPAAVRVYGRQAMVRLGDRTLFLSRFTGGWRVVAAGCTPQGERPHRCVVGGG